MSSLATGFATFPDPLAVSDLPPAPVPQGLVDDITFGPLVLQFPSQLYKIFILK